MENPKSLSQKNFDALLDGKGFCFLSTIFCLVAMRLLKFARARDMVKVRPYWQRLAINKWRQMEAERRREFQRDMSGLSLFEQYKYLNKLTNDYLKMWKVHDYVKRTLTFTIDIPEILRTLGDQCNGRPLITSTPKTLNCRLDDLRIKFRLKVNDNLILPYSTLTFT